MDVDSINKFLVCYQENLSAKCRYFQIKNEFNAVVIQRLRECLAYVALEKRAEGSPVHPRVGGNFVDGNVAHIVAGDSHHSRPRSQTGRTAQSFCNNFLVQVETDCIHRPQS